VVKSINGINMYFSKPITEIIKERKSRRTYLRTLDEETREKIVNLLKNSDFSSPFSDYAGKIRFELIAVPEFDPQEKKKLGTYGFIKGAHYFIVGAVEKSQFDREHYGYLLETTILAATDMGLGTCWLGGTFNRDLFSSKINCLSNEIVPAISPIGYSDDMSAREKFIRRMAKAKKRFPWEKLFFDGSFKTPLKQETTGKYATLLEMVRLGPSAGNKQPWRIVKELNHDIFHFYIIKSDGIFTKIYDKFRHLDVGIAVSHFDLTAKELGLGGTWFFEKPHISGSDEFFYIISWRGQK